MDVLTANDLVQQVRDQIDEQNTKTKSDSSILAVLNRGQRLAAVILSRRYPEPLLADYPVTLIPGTQDYRVPMDSLEDRVVYVSLLNGGAGSQPVWLPRRDFRDIQVQANSAPGYRSNPVVWAAFAKFVRVFPIPSAGTMNWLYVKAPKPLALMQGRVTGIGANYVVVDPETQGTDMSTESDRLQSYVSIVNWATGEVKGTFQVQSIVDGKVTFAETPLRSSVRNEEIAAGSTLGTTGIDYDDYLVLVGNTCVSFFQGSVSNHLIAYASALLKLSLEGQAQFEEAIAKDCQEWIESQYHGRETAERIQPISPIWPGSVTLWPYSAS